MKKCFKYSLPLLLCVGLVANAQNNQSSKTKKNNYISTLGENGYTNGDRISVSMLDSVLSLPVCIYDSAGVKFDPIGYEFMYAERGVYEDSTGKPIVMTDYLTINVMGSTIPAFFKEDLKPIYKAGDTLIFWRVMGNKIGAEERVTIQSTPIKLIISR